MREAFAFAALLAAVGALMSCSPLTGPLPAGMVEGPDVQHVPYAGSFTYTVDPGATPRDVYFVFTNASLTQDAAQGPSISNAAIGVDGRALPAPSPQPLASRNSAPHSLADRIAELNRDPTPLLNARPARIGAAARAQFVAGAPAQDDAVGLAEGFSVADLVTGASTAVVNAKCQLVRKGVDLGDGRKRSLSIWVDDVSWDDTGTVPGKIGPAMITAMADRFLLASGAADDIYHWNTAVIGEPWGPHSDPRLIEWDPGNTITILLTNLNIDYSSGVPVTVGYFSNKDNYAVSVVSQSNQRIMFYIDARLYATVLSEPPENGAAWQSSFHWPQLVFSALAHEFQHMIHFYQKQVLRAASGTDTWINEMCSMLMEDLVADKLGVPGPRGVPSTDGSAGAPPISAGRIPDFNSNSGTPLAVNDNYVLVDYSVTYAFGAWLIRNYGGADLLRRIVQSPSTDSSAVVAAASSASGKEETMQRLLEKWSVAVLLSDTTSVPPGYRYNTGGWMTSFANSLPFHLGSIDIFNYTPGLSVFTSPSTLSGTAALHSSNIYYRAAAGLNAPRSWSITLPPGTLMSVVTR